MIVPHIVERPEVLANHLLQRLLDRNLSTNTRLGIKAESTTRSLLQIPVVGRHIIVRTGHLHARETRHLALGVSGRDKMRTIIRLFQDGYVFALEIGMRQKVATYEPSNDAGVTTQPAHLIAKRTTDEGNILRIHNATIFLVDGFAKILSPLPLTAPTREHQQTITVAEVIDVLRSAPDVLEADAVEIHVAHIAHLQFIGLRRIAQEDIIRPTCTSDEHRFAIEHKPTEALRGIVILHLADTEGKLFIVSNLSIGHKLKRHVVKLGLAHVMAPPQTGILHMECLEIAHAEIAHLMGSQRNGSRKLATIKLTTHLALDGFVSQVAEGGTNGEPSLIERLQIEL